MVPIYCLLLNLRVKRYLSDSASTPPYYPDPLPINCNLSNTYYELSHLAGELAKTANNRWLCWLMLAKVVGSPGSARPYLATVF